LAQENTAIHWPAEVQIVPRTVPAGTKRKLKEQPHVIQAIVHHSIAQATDEIILERNWPEADNRNVYAKALLLKACKDVDIRNTYDIAHEVRRRIKVDPYFTKALCNLVRFFRDAIMNLATDLISRLWTGSRL